VRSTVSFLLMTIEAIGQRVSAQRHVPKQLPNETPERIVRGFHLPRDAGTRQY
jgi:hypothetical protein